VQAHGGAAQLLVDSLHGAGCQRGTIDVDGPVPDDHDERGQRCGQHRAPTGEERQHGCRTIAVSTTRARPKRWASSFPVIETTMPAPALDDIIAQASSDYIRAFHTHNVIGHGNRWHDGRIFKCAAKGDLNRFKSIASWGSNQVRILRPTRAGSTLNRHDD
jgi:hypothetical protein